MQIRTRRGGRLLMLLLLSVTGVCFFVQCKNNASPKLDLFGKHNQQKLDVTTTQQPKLAAEEVANSVIKQVTNDLWPVALLGVVVVVCMAALPLVALALLIRYWINKQPPSHIRCPHYANPPISTSNSNKPSSERSSSPSSNSSDFH